MRYDLAQINHEAYRGDNGKVIGYDNARGSNRRHYKDKVEVVEFISLEDIEDRFQADWMIFKRKVRKCERRSRSNLPRSISNAAS